MGLSNRDWLDMSVRKWLVGAGKAHINRGFGLKMSCRDRIGRLDRSGGTDGDRAVRKNRQLRA